MALVIGPTLTLGKKILRMVQSNCESAQVCKGFAALSIKHAALLQCSAALNKLEPLVVLDLSADSWRLIKEAISSLDSDKRDWLAAAVPTSSDLIASSSALRCHWTDLSLDLLMERVGQLIDQIEAQQVLSGEY